MSVGLVSLDPPLTGTWPLSDYPPEVLLQGRRLKRVDEWRFPYSGVAAQYREELDRNALHLLVYDDGHFLGDHLDEANPDRGHVLAHALRDVSATPVGVLAAVAGVAIGTTVLVRWIGRRRRN